MKKLFRTGAPFHGTTVLGQRNMTEMEDSHFWRGERVSCVELAFRECGLASSSSVIAGLWITLYVQECTAEEK